MATYILYGSKLSLAEAKEILEELLTLQFEARESAYQCGEYFRVGNRAGEHFKLKKNADPFDGDPVEMKFPEFPTLLYINATSRSEELREIVEHARGSFAFLRDWLAFSQITLAFRDPMHMTTDYGLACKYKKSCYSLD
jgi:hypothetical protein